MLEKSGVYKITNIINGKIYVGGAVCFRVRWGQHKYKLKNDKHHSIHLQRSWDKYGEENFVFKILEIVEDKEKLLKREQHWLDKTECCKREFGYNICSTAGSQLGYKHTEEARHKMSNSHKELYKNGYVSSNLGKKHTKKSKKKMSLALSGKNHPIYGKNHSKKTKKKMSKTHKGKIISEESKKNMSNAQKKLYENGYQHPMLDKRHTEEAKQKMSKAQKGKKHTAESKLKMSKETRGENNPRAKLTEKQVRIIKWLLKNSDMTQKEIGKIFNVDRTTINCINIKKTWKHI